MRRLVLCLAAGLALALTSCSLTATWVREGLDVNSLPPDVRDDYAVFAQRCSKCHSLSRPLNSGIDDDEYWIRYVARMRLQPGSGISRDDVAVILRFLRYFSADLRSKKAARSQGALPPPAASPPSPSPPPPPAKEL
jgi:hypothetical protein